MMRYIKIILIILTVFAVSCKEKLPPNKVDIDQLNYDKTNDYNYIFKDLMEEEKRKKEKYKKRDFQ